MLLGRIIRDAATLLVETILRVLLMAQLTAHAILLATQMLGLLT